jgi:hypothetical protein
MSSIPERQSGTSLDRSEGTAPPNDRAWLIAAAFVALVLVVGFLLAVYVLAWDGGAHT